MSTNPILSAQENSQPDDSIVVPPIKVAPPESPVSPPVAPPVQSNPSPAAPTLESLMGSNQSTYDPTMPQTDAVDVVAPLENLQVPAGAQNPITPLEQVIDPRSTGDEYMQAVGRITGSQDKLLKALKPVPLPTDMQLPTLFGGDIDSVQGGLNRLGGKINDVINAKSADSNYLRNAMASLASDTKKKPPTEGFMQWLIGSNPTNDFNPVKGQWGDYGSGALGASMFALGFLGKLQATLIGGGVDNGLNAWNVVESIKARGFNPFSAEWRRDFEKEFAQRSLYSSPDPVLAIQTKQPKSISQWFDYLGSRSFMLAPLLTPGRDISFSNWQNDRNGRNNPLGFLYGKQGQDDGKADLFRDIANVTTAGLFSSVEGMNKRPSKYQFGRGLGALALDIITDPSALLRKPIKKVVQESAEQAAKAATEQAARREAGRAVMIGLDPVSARANPMKMPGNVVMQAGREGAAYVRPSEVVKKYREYQRRLALPPAKDVPGVIDAAVSTVSGGSIPGTPRTVRQVAELAAQNPDQLPELAQRFKEVDGREFPRGSLQVELDQLSDELAKAKTPKGQEAARQRFYRRVNKLDERWNKANPVLEVQPAPDLSRYDQTIWDDALLAPSGESPVKLLPEQSGRVNFTFEPKNTPTLVIDGKGRFVPATKETVNDYLKRVDSWTNAQSWKRAALPMADDSAEYASQKVYIEDTSLRDALNTFISTGRGQRAALEGEPLYKTPSKVAVDLGDAKVFIPAERVPLNQARDAFMSTMELSDYLPKRPSLQSLLEGNRETLDGVTMMNRGEMDEFAARVAGTAHKLLPPSFIPPNAVPVRTFAPQSEILKLLEGGKLVDVHSLDNYTTRSVRELNELVSFLPSPDGSRLLDRSYDTYEGLVSAVQRRLSGYSQEVIEHYLSTITRLGQRIQNLNGDVVEVALSRSGADGVPGSTALMSKQPPLQRAPLALPEGRIPTLEDIGRALNEGHDPEPLLDELVEPSLDNPVVRRNILENTPEEFRGLTQNTQEMAIQRYVMERQLDDLTGRRAELERTRDAVQERLQEVLDDVETTPDLGAKTFDQVELPTPASSKPIKPGKISSYQFLNQLLGDELGSSVNMRAEKIFGDRLDEQIDAGDMRFASLYPHEYSTLRLYVGNRFYRAINEFLRSGSLNEASRDGIRFYYKNVLLLPDDVIEEAVNNTEKFLPGIVEELDTIMNKLPSKEGTFTRGLSVPESEVNSILAQHPVGGTFKTNAYLSVTTNPEISERFADKINKPVSVRYTIEGKSAKDVDNAYESEYLFPRNTPFEVVSVNVDGNKIDIRMIESQPQLGARAFRQAELDPQGLANSPFSDSPDYSTLLQRAEDYITKLPEGDDRRNLMPIIRRSLSDFEQADMPLSGGVDLLNTIFGLSGEASKVNTDGMIVAAESMLRNPAISTKDADAIREALKTYRPEYNQGLVRAMRDARINSIPSVELSPSYWSVIKDNPRYQRMVEIANGERPPAIRQVDDAIDEYYEKFVELDDDAERPFGAVEILMSHADDGEISVDFSVYGDFTRNQGVDVPLRDLARAQRWFIELADKYPDVIFKSSVAFSSREELLSKIRNYAAIGFVPGHKYSPTQLYDFSKGIDHLLLNQFSVYYIGGNYKKSLLATKPAPFYHGTRVRDLELNKIDPVQGAARGEFGTAIYLTKNPRQAEYHAMADVAPNLPVIGSREFGDGFVHEVAVDKYATILSADSLTSPESFDDLLSSLRSSADELDDSAKDIEKSLKSWFNAKPRTYNEVFDYMQVITDRVQSRLNPSYSGIDEAFMLKWQRSFTEALRSRGIAGIENGDVVAIFEPDAIRPMHIKPYGNEIESPLSVAAARYNALTMAVQNNPKSTMLQVQQKEALATLLTRVDDKLEGEMSDLDEQIIRQLSDMMTHDEKLRSAVEGERAAKIQQVTTRLEQADANTLRTNPFNNNPCL